MKDLLYGLGICGLAGILIAVVLGVVQAAHDHKVIGTTVSYQNESVMVLAADTKTFPVLYVVRRKDGTTVLAPLSDLKPLTEKP